MHAAMSCIWHLGAMLLRSARASPASLTRGAKGLTDEGEKFFDIEGLYEKDKRAAFERSGAGVTPAFCASLTSSATETTRIFCITRAR
jgi:hypothetical protein